MYLINFFSGKQLRPFKYINIFREYGVKSFLNLF